MYRNGFIIKLYKSIVVFQNTDLLSVETDARRRDLSHCVTARLDLVPEPFVCSP